MQNQKTFGRSTAMLVSAGLSLALWIATPVAAQTADPTPAQTVKKPKKASKATQGKKARKVKPVESESRLPGGETRAERDRRLLRECKGRPNAGACSGYAS